MPAPHADRFCENNALAASNPMPHMDWEWTSPGGLIVDRLCIVTAKPVIK